MRLQESYTPFTLTSLAATVCLAVWCVPELWRAQDMNGIAGVCFYIFMIVGMVCLDRERLQSNCLLALFAFSACFGFSMQTVAAELHVLAILALLTCVMLLVEAGVKLVRRWKMS